MTCSLNVIVLTILLWSTCYIGNLHSLGPQHLYIWFKGCKQAHAMQMAVCDQDGILSCSAWQHCSYLAIGLHSYTGLVSCVDTAVASIQSHHQYLMCLSLPPWIRVCVNLMLFCLSSLLMMLLVNLLRASIRFLVWSFRCTNNNIRDTASTMSKMTAGAWVLNGIWNVSLGPT